MTAPPTLSEWKALYQAAADFKKLAAWDWMEDADIFGIVNPETGETGYCCVLGNLGEVYALNVYRGSAGLRLLVQMYSGELGPGNPEVLISQDCLMASFENRDDLEAEDRDLIKKLGLKFRGANAWPIFREFQPNHPAWFLDGAQTRFLTLALEQTIQVAQAFSSNPRYLTPAGRLGSEPPDMESLYRVRVPVKGENGLTWTDEWRKPELIKPPEPVSVPLDELRLERIRKHTTQRQGSYEFDCFALLSPVQEEDERPFFPYLCLLADRNLGMPVAQALTKPHERYEKTMEAILQFFEQSQTIPVEIVVKSAGVAEILEPVAKKLKFKLKTAKRLTLLEQIQMSMYSMF
ncbi:MAG: hypothetical protein K1Y36_02760 [Blastocatellia bacterium]|nr:hypothetical protein [Blastocatellia bacterium]